MTKKTSTRGQQKREQLREAAYRCFRDNGYHQTTVDGICEAAKTSKGSFYWHYPSKDDVFVDIIETWSREVMDQLYEQFEDAVLDANAVAAVSEALEREVRRGLAIVPLWLEFIVHARNQPELRHALGKFFQRARSALTEILRPQLGAVCTEDEVRGTAAIAFGAFAGVIIQHLSDPDRVDATVFVRDFMAAFAKLIALRPSA